MGEIYLLKCKKCNNKWSHYEGVGETLEPYPIEALEENETCDKQGDIKCPKCQAEVWDAFDGGCWD